MEKEVTKKQPDERTNEDQERNLVLFNDDFNTFDWVIKSLIEVCDHEPEQAEQCALITHMKGKCPVKSGGFDELKPMKQELTNRELTVEIH